MRNELYIRPQQVWIKCGRKTHIFRILLFQAHMQPPKLLIVRIFRILHYGGGLRNGGSEQGNVETRNPVNFRSTPFQNP